MEGKRKKLNNITERNKSEEQDDKNNIEKEGKERENQIIRRKYREDNKENEGKREGGVEKRKRKGKKRDYR